MDRPTVLLLLQIYRKGLRTATWNLERSRGVLIGGGGDGSDGPPYCVAAANR